MAKLYKTELNKKVFKILKRYENSQFPLTPTCISGLSRVTLDPLYDLLKSESRPNRLEPRPDTGLRQDKSQGASPTAIHKITLIQYLNRYGFPFQETDYVSLTPSLLEAAVNYLWEEKNH